jgi:hypothetical protein
MDGNLVSHLEAERDLPASDRQHRYFELAIGASDAIDYDRLLPFPG